MFATFTQLAPARELEGVYEKVQLSVGGKNVEAYVADTPAKRSEGLMNVAKLKTNTGMLFVFDTEDHLAFWMKQTLIPLSIGFFNAQGVLVDVQEMKVLESVLVKEIPSYRSREPALFALEMNAGWFGKQNLKAGAKLELRSKTSSALLNRKLTAPKTSRQ